jgi:IPT/TIG domain
MKTILIMRHVSIVLLTLTFFAASGRDLYAELTDPCLAVNIPLTERIESSQAIVYGRVIAQRSTWDDAERSIYTLNTVIVHDVWKGANIADTITVLTEGGDMGSYGRTVIGTLKLSIGDVGYIFLEYPRDTDVTFYKSGASHFYRPYAEVQALLVQREDQFLYDCWGTTGLSPYTFEHDALAPLQHVVRSLRPLDSSRRDRFSKQVEIAQGGVTLASDRVIGGAGDTAVIRGSGFGNERGSNYVTFTSDGTNYHTAEYARQFVYRTWTDNEIIVEVPPSFSGKVRVVVGDKTYESMNVLHVTSNLNARTLSPLTYTNLINTDGKGGYTWSVDKALYDNEQARTCVESVMRQFRCKTGMSFTVAPVSTDAGYKLNDGVNAIVFDTPAYELGAGAVAYADWIWYSCIVGDQTFYYVRDTDCRLSRKFNWYYGNGKNPEFGMAKLRYVLYHEIGHAHQFGHVNEPGESMHPIVQALPAEEWLHRDTITTSEKRAGWFMTRRGRDFTFRGCGITPLLPPQTDDCNSDVTSGIHDDRSVAHAGVGVWPNPADAILHVSLPQTIAAGSAATIIDLLGIDRASIVIPSGTDHVTLPVDELPAGRYIVIIRTPVSTRYYGSFNVQ